MFSVAVVSKKGLEPLWREAVPCGPRVSQEDFPECVVLTFSRHDWATSLLFFAFMHWRRRWQPTPVFLPGESQGRRSLVGCLLWGHTEVGHDWSDLAAKKLCLDGNHPSERLSPPFPPSQSEAWRGKDIQEKQEEQGQTKWGEAGFYERENVFVLHFPFNFFNNFF